MSKLVIILGGNGDLARSFITTIPNEYDIICIDKYFDPNALLVDQKLCDFSDRNQINLLLNNLACMTYAKIILVSCIGIAGGDSFTLEKPDQEIVELLYQSVQINLVGIAHFILSFTKKYRDIPMRIIIVSSTAAYVGNRDLGYSIAKGGLNSLVVSLSKFYAAKNREVIGVAPGGFSSKMFLQVSRQRQYDVINSTHIKRLGNISEISNLLNYLAFHSSGYLTGSIIKINLN